MPQSQSDKLYIRVPSPLMKELTDIAQALSKPRSDVILRSLSRDLPTLRQEASKAVQQRQVREREFGEWDR